MADAEEEHRSHGSLIVGAQVEVRLKPNGSRENFIIAKNIYVNKTLRYRILARAKQPSAEAQEDQQLLCDEDENHFKLYKVDGRARLQIRRTTKSTMQLYLLPSDPLEDIDHEGVPDASSHFMTKDEVAALDGNSGQEEKKLRVPQGARVVGGRRFSDRSDSRTRGRMVQQVTNVRLPPLEGIDLDTIETLVNLWVDDCRAVGIRPLVSELLGQLPKKERVLLAKRRDVGSVEDCMDALKEIREGESKFRIFGILEEAATYRRAEGATVEEHAARVAEIKRKVSATLQCDLPSVLWGWMMLESFGLESEEALQLRAMTNGDLSHSNVKACLAAYFRNGRGPGVGESRNKEQVNRSIEEAVDRALEARMKNAPGGKEWKPACKYGSECKNKESCGQKFWHPRPRKKQQANVTKEQGADTTNPDQGSSPEQN